ncbi:uncharacterized protein SCHCODRAFT_01349877 [Schizophyllum commune H4-8]|uniref:Uncharacterized protein n=1 Tax=Schizophyllum commune (strain H4-8 / FGSC 9210) TaxID=578458 RepID=D8Q2G3_SCHCM|nr:uncharacterized protein SCHCODRAFT_01349877 [Schizophyllum commune H4-8]KAI5895870.1 hypothetical protein SCHCODRAFT_01349877 [Schizophyllum commune H4-8]
MSTTSSPTSSPPVSTASRAMTPPWQPLRLEDAWKALPFADVDELPRSGATDDEATKRTSEEAIQVDANERRVRFGVDTVAEYSVQVPDVAAEGAEFPDASTEIAMFTHRLEEDVLRFAPMDIDEPAVKVDAKSAKKAILSTDVAALTSKPSHPHTASGALKNPILEPEEHTFKPKKKKTRPVSLSNPPLLDYMCRCDDCAARRAEFLQTIGRRTVRWDEWPWYMVGDGYGTWYEEEAWAATLVVNRHSSVLAIIMSLSQSKALLYKPHWHHLALLGCRLKS